MAVIGAWLALFAGGQLVSTREHRCVVSPPAVRALAGTAPEDPDPCADVADAGAPWSSGVFWQSAAIASALFTVTNLALLSSLAAVIGAFGRRARLGPHRPGAHDADPTNPYLSGAVRGFFVYLVTISGVLALIDEPFSQPGPGQYLRLAGFLSLLSFAVSYEPEIFASLFERARSRFEETEGAETGRTQEETEELSIRATHRSAEHGGLERPDLPHRTGHS